MVPGVTANGGLVRLLVFLGVLLSLMALEAGFPKRRRAIPRRDRWPANLLITLLGALLARLCFPMGAVGMAVVVERWGWGLLPATDLPRVAQSVLAFVLLDLAIYVQHILFHRIPVLWRLHRVHHADEELDVTSGSRFHPVEILLSMGIKGVWIAALGATPEGVLAFEIVLNAGAMFNHANLRIPPWLDAPLRLLVVTPDMHRVHHSIIRAETDSNFGFNFPWWDRLFGTYRPEPGQGHEGMTIGIPAFRDPAELRLDRMLTQPFRSAAE